MNPHLISLGTALPVTRFSQEELRLAYHDVSADHLRPMSLRMVDRIFDPQNGIESRAIACAEPRTIAAEGPDELHERFERNAVELGTKALRAALGNASIEPSELRALVACTCTGYLCPGLTSYLAENLALSEDLQVFDLVGMGCGASMPALNLAQQLVRNASEWPVAIVSAEICSAAAYFGDDPELIVSNCIFGDGAAAAIVAMPSAVSAKNRPTLELLDFESSLWPEYRDRLRFRQSDGKLRNCLHRDIPDLAAEMADRTITRLLKRHSLALSDISRWAIHPGGKRVLEQFAQRLQLNRGQLEDSYNVLATCGNISSPSVLFVVEKLINREDWRAGELGICSAFGAGLTCHVGLFRTAWG